MIGYIIAAVVFKVAGGSQCFTWYCWRVPLILEGCLLVPFSISIFFFKRSLVAVPVRHGGEASVIMTKEAHDTTQSFDASDNMSGMNYFLLFRLTPIIDRKLHDEP
jgi:hypothetical protein